MCAILGRIDSWTTDRFVSGRRPFVGAVRAAMKVERFAVPRVRYEGTRTLATSNEPRVCVSVVVTSVVEDIF